VRTATRSAEAARRWASRGGPLQRVDRRAAAHRRERNDRARTQASRVGRAAV